MNSTRALFGYWEWYGLMMETYPDEASYEAGYRLWRNDLTRWDRWRLDRANKASATRPTTEEQ